MINVLGKNREGSLIMPANQRILIIEDERNLSRFVELELSMKAMKQKYAQMAVAVYKQQSMSIGMLFY